MVLFLIRQQIGEACWRSKNTVGVTTPIKPVDNVSNVWADRWTLLVRYKAYLMRIDYGKEQYLLMAGL